MWQRRQLVLASEQGAGHRIIIFMAAGLVFLCGNFPLVRLTQRPPSILAIYTLIYIGSGPSNFRIIGSISSRIIETCLPSEASQNVNWLLQLFQSKFILVGRAMQVNDHIVACWFNSIVNQYSINQMTFVKHLHRYHVQLAKTKEAYLLHGNCVFV